MKIKIWNWKTGEIIINNEYNSYKEAVEANKYRSQRC
jgi:hypothetical protein